MVILKSTWIIVNLNSARSLSLVSSTNTRIRFTTTSVSGSLNAFSRSPASLVLSTTFAMFQINDHRFICNTDKNNKNVVKLPKLTRPVTHHVRYKPPPVDLPHRPATSHNHLPPLAHLKFLQKLKRLNKNLV